jgi:hypothetical protein
MENLHSYIPYLQSIENKELSPLPIILRELTQLSPLPIIYRELTELSFLPTINRELTKQYGCIKQWYITLIRR